MKINKNIIYSFFSLVSYFYSTIIYAQAPNAVPYQGVTRNVDGKRLLIWVRNNTANGIGPGKKIH